MNREWPMFRAVMSNLAMVLAKTDLQIASLYAELVPDLQLRSSIMNVITSEHALTCSWVHKITGHQTLLFDNPTLERSISDRFPYLDPLNVLQVELLARRRASGSEELVDRAVQLTLNGLATGLRNSG